MIMELKKDLLIPTKKSKFRVILGILFVVLSASWIALRIIDDQIIRPFDWIYSGVFALTGLAHALDGFGISFLALFFKAFLSIDTERISVKLGVFAKEFNLDWMEVQSINYTLNKFQFMQKDGHIKIMDVSTLDYTSKNELKSVIQDIALSKQIQTVIR